MAEASADRPATTLADFADGDCALTVDAAIAWLIKCGQSEGSARKLLRDGWKSGNILVRVTRYGRDDWGCLAEYGEDGAFGLGGEPVDIAPSRVCEWDLV